jgi:tripartite-type tricarboxylate transporter receptor subunit TctC
MFLKQVVTAILLLSATAVVAQSYPAKSVRIVVPFAAGGNTDFTGRTIAAKLTEALGQQFLVDNRPGGSTNIGSDTIVKSAPDGYNICNAPALTDLIGGHVEMIISGVPALIPHIKSGRIRSVAIGSLKRFAAVPEVPTFDEQGLKGYEASTWFGLMAPAKTPRDIIAKLNTEVGKILASKDIRERYQVEGLEPQGGSPEAFAQFINAEIALYTRVVKAANSPKL